MYEEINKTMKKFNANVYLINQYCLELRTPYESQIWLRAKYYYTKRCEIENLVIDRKYRKNGYGRELVNLVENFSRIMGINKIIISANTNRKFWEHMGYFNDEKILK